MGYELKVIDGKVKYLCRFDNTMVGSDTKEESAKEMLSRGQPYKSDVFKDFPIALQDNGGEYFFAGTWEDESIFAVEPKRKRKTRDVLTE